MIEELFCFAALAGFVLSLVIVLVAAAMRSSQISREEERRQ